MDIGVDQGNSSALLRFGNGVVDGNGRFADTALRVDHCDNFGWHKLDCLHACMFAYKLFCLRANKFSRPGLHLDCRSDDSPTLLHSIPGEERTPGQKDAFPRRGGDFESVGEGSPGLLVCLLTSVHAYKHVCLFTFISSIPLIYPELL